MYLYDTRYAGEGRKLIGSSFTFRWCHQAKEGGLQNTAENERVNVSQRWCFSMLRSLLKCLQCYKGKGSHSLSHETLTVYPRVLLLLASATKMRQALHVNYTSASDLCHKQNPILTLCCNFLHNLTFTCRGSRWPWHPPPAHLRQHWGLPKPAERWASDILPCLKHITQVWSRRQPSQMPEPSVQSLWPQWRIRTWAGKSTALLSQSALSSPQPTTSLL